jgi:hypothetical protein
MAYVVEREFNLPDSASIWKVRKVVAGTVLTESEYQSLDAVHQACVQDTEAGFKSPAGDSLVTVHEEEHGRKALEDMTVSQLRALVEAHEVEVDGKNKQSIVDALRAAGIEG